MLAPPDTRKSTFTTPPFSTKEPDRYQAIRITSFSETANNEDSSSSQSNQVLIARDGERRREEYSSGAAGRLFILKFLLAVSLFCLQAGCMQTSVQHQHPA